MPRTAEPSATRDDGGPAFPMCGEVYGKAGDTRWAPGMSLRDYFAAAALTGLLANESQSSQNTHSQDARFCYAAADAMLEARQTGGPS